MFVGDFWWTFTLPALHLWQQLFSNVRTAKTLHLRLVVDEQWVHVYRPLMGQACFSSWSHRFVCCDWTPGNSGGCARHWMNGCKSSTKAWRNFHVSGALHQTYTWTVPRNVIHGSILPPGRPSFYGFLNQAGKVNSLFLTLAAVGPAPISCRGRGWAAACSRTSFCAVERDNFRTIFVLSVGMWVQFHSQVPMATMVLVIQLFLMKKQFVP